MGDPYARRGWDQGTSGVGYSAQQPQQTAPASRGAPAPGFARATPSEPVVNLPKVWEYEDPLKDVHGPFTAQQILNWYAQDW
jgi:hypothetical protein